MVVVMYAALSSPAAPSVESVVVTPAEARVRHETYRKKIVSAQDAVRVAVHALVDAADDDAATGGPDTTRRIWPVVATVTSAGYQRVDDDTLGAVVAEIEAMRRAGGPGGGEPR